MELSKAPNIGKKLEQQCRQAGVESIEELRTASSKAVWLKILAFDSSACVNRLYALEGAVRGIDKKLLPSEVKEELKQFVRAAKKAD